jgi:hypothetical protein
MTNTNIHEGTPVPSHCVLRPRYEDTTSKIMTVEFYWRMSNGALLDRPHTYGMTCIDRNAPRLVRAFMEGALFPTPYLSFDINQRSYIAGGCAVYGKRINADLTRLGY